MNIYRFKNDDYDATYSADKGELVDIIKCCDDFKRLDLKAVLAIRHKRYYKEGAKDSIITKLDRKEYFKELIMI